MTKLVSELDWIKIEQKLASPFHPISILSQCSGAKWDSNPMTIHSRHVWGKIHKGCRTSHYKQSYASLWNNPEIRIGKVGVFWKQWQLKGVNVIGDLYENGLFMSYSELVKKYNIGGQGNFWKYLQIRHCVKNKFNASNNPVYAYLELPRVAQSASMCYKSMLSVTADTCNNLKTIWQKDLGININDDDWRYIISNVGKNIREVRGKFIQYKIIHRYYYTPSRLYRMGIAGNNLCWKCNEEEGTYLHMIWECSLVHPFWCKILAILEEWMGSNLPVEPRLCLLGNKPMIPNIEKNKFTLIKIGCITAARMILRNWKCPKTPDLKDWVDGMIEIASYESMLGRLHNEGEIKKTWDHFWQHIKMV